MKPKHLRNVYKKVIKPSLILRDKITFQDTDGNIYEDVKVNITPYKEPRTMEQSDSMTFGRPAVNILTKDKRDLFDCMFKYQGSFYKVKSKKTNSLQGEIFFYRYVAISIDCGIDKTT